jgi:hypothetical protein
MTCKRELEKWENKMANTEAKPQAVWPIVELLINWDAPRAPPAIHSFLGLILENLFAHHDL